MQVNSQSSGSQMDSVERMPRLQYRDSLEEDTYGNKSISKHSFRNTQNSSSTLNQNEIVSGDQKLYQYEYEIYQRNNQQIIQQQDKQMEYPTQNQYQQQQQQLENFLQQYIASKQQLQGNSQFNQIDPRKRLFVQNHQNQGLEDYMDYQNQEAFEGEQQLDIYNQQGEQLNEQKSDQDEENEYYDQAHNPIEQDDQDTNEEQNYNDKEGNDEEIDDLDENGNNTQGRNLLNEYLQMQSEKGQFGYQQDDQQEEINNEDEGDQIEQNYAIESLITEKFEGDNPLSQLQHQEQYKSGGIQQQNELEHHHHSKNQTPTNAQNQQYEQDQVSQLDSKLNKMREYDSQYSFPVQMNSHLFSQNSQQRQQFNPIQQSDESKNQQMRNSNLNDQSHSSSSASSNPQFQSLQHQNRQLNQSNQNEHKSNSLRESDHQFHSQNSSINQSLNNRQSNHLYSLQEKFSDSLNQKQSQMSQNSQSYLNSMRISNHSQQHQQHQHQQDSFQTIQELKQNSQFKESDQFNEIIHEGNPDLFQKSQQEKEIYQINSTLTPKATQSKREDQMTNETFQVRNQNNQEENYTYRSKESIDLTKRSTLSNGSATQVAQKQLYLLNLLEQKEQLNSERYNMLVRDEEIIEQELPSSNRTDIRVNSEDYHQLKQLIMSKTSSSQPQQSNGQNNLRLEDNLQFNKQSSIQSQLTPESRYKQLSSITGNNTKELFEYSNSSNKNNLTNNLFDSQPRVVNDYYDSTIKNRLKVDLFKKLTDPTMVGNQQNLENLENGQNNEQEYYNKINDLEVGNNKLDVKRNIYNIQQESNTSTLNNQRNLNGLSNKYDFTRKQNEKEEPTQQQNAESQQGYFYSEISPIDKGPRYQKGNQYLTSNNDQMRRQQPSHNNVIENNSHTNQITFQNNFQFQSNSNLKESVDDEMSHRTPTNQNKKQIYRQSSNDFQAQNQIHPNQPNFFKDTTTENNQQVQKSYDAPQQKQEYHYNFLERKKQIQNEQQQQEQQQQRRLSNHQQEQFTQKQANHQPGHQQQQIPKSNISQSVLNRFIKQRQYNLENAEDQQNEINPLQDDLNHKNDQDYQMADQTAYNQYNIAKYQRKIASYQPDFVQKLQEYQQMSDKKKREYDELQNLELQILENNFQQKSPNLRQPKENTYIPSNSLMKGVNLRKLNQSMRNSIKKNLNSHKKQNKKSFDISITNTSMRQTQQNIINNSNYSLFSPQKNYINSNSFRNDQKIRNEMIMNNLNYSPSSEIDNLNSSSNDKPYFSSSYAQIRNVPSKNKRQLFNENTKKSQSPNKIQNENRSNSCSQCKTCKQSLPPQPFNLQNNKQFKNSNITPNSKSENQNFFNFYKNNQEYQQEQLINFQMSDITSPISQIKSASKSPIKLDSLGTSPLKFGSNLNSPLEKSIENAIKNKSFTYDPIRYNGYDYRNIPKKQLNNNKSQSLNLNVTSTSDIHPFNLEEVEKQCIQHIQNQQFEQAQVLLSQIESFIYNTFLPNHPQRIYVNYLNARVQQGLGQSSTAVKYCERGLKEIIKEDLYSDPYLYKYSFSLRQLAQSECKKTQQVSQQKYYLAQMEEQLSYCERDFQNLNIEIARIYSDYNAKFGLQIYRELAKVCQELKDYFNACRYIKIIFSKINCIEVDLSVSLIDMLILNNQKEEAVEELKKIIKYLRTIETTFVRRDELLIQYIDNLANLYFEMKEYELSSDWFEQSLQIKTNLYGQSHQITGVGYFLCGKSHHKLNNSMKAIQRLSSSVAILDKHFTLFNLYSANSILTIAEIAKQDQKIDEAIKNYKSAFERFSGIFGSDHFNCLCILLNLVYLTCQYTQSTTQVQVFFGEIIKNTENKINLDSIQVLNEMSNILRQNNFVQQSLEGYLIARQKLSSLLHQMNLFIFFIKSNILKKLKQNLAGVEDRQVNYNLFFVSMNLGSTYQLIQQHDKAIMTYFEALSLSNSLQQQSNEYKFKIHNNLAQSFAALNKYFEAQQQYQEALNILSTKEGFISEKEELRMLIKQCMKK